MTARRSIQWPAGFAALALFMIGAAAARAGGGPALIQRALSCALTPAEIAGLPTALRGADPGFAEPARQFALPSYDLYKLRHPVTALGYASDEIVLQPGRVLMLVPAAGRAAAEAALGLMADPITGLSERAVADARSIVAYEPHRPEIPGKLFLGCQYALPEAAGWLEQGRSPKIDLVPRP